MKVKEEFVIREVAGENIVVSTDAKAVNFSGMLVLNGTGTFLFNLMQKDVSVDYLVDELMKKYEVDEKSARLDCLAFVNKLKEKNILE